MKKCVQTETPELLTPLNYDADLARDGPKIKRISSQRRVAEVGNSCSLQIFEQWKGEPFTENVFQGKTILSPKILLLRAITR